jgi:hypothetical protein
MLHQPYARGVGHLLGQKAIDQGDDADQHVREHSECELGRQQNTQPLQLAARQPAVECRGPARHLHHAHDVVDDQLADIEGHHRHERAHQSQRERGSHQRRARPPDHGDEGPERAQRAEALFQ